MTKWANKHLLLCATPTKQKCFKGNEGQKAWECLKKTLKKFENDPSTKSQHKLHISVKKNLIATNFRSNINNINIRICFDC